MTVALVSITPLAILQTSANASDRFIVPGVGDVYGSAVGTNWGNYKLTTVAIADSPVDQYSTFQNDALSLAGNTLTITRTYTQRAPTKAELLSYAAGKKSQLSIAGTSLGATPVPTDLETRSLLSLAYTKSLATPTFTMSWITPTGPITLNAANIQAAAQQVGTFLADCIARQVTANAGINNGTITTTAQVDAVFEA